MGKALRATSLIGLIVCLVWAGIAPAYAECRCYEPVASGGRDHVTNSKACLQPHKHCSEIETKPREIDRGCPFKMLYYAGCVVPRVTYRTLPTFPILSTAMLLPDQPSWSFNDGNSNPAVALLGPLYLRNLPLRC